VESSARDFILATSTPSALTRDRSACLLLIAGLLLGLLLDTEEGGCIFIRKIGPFLSYMEVRPRRPNSSVPLEICLIEGINVLENGKIT
jgi:hypothetical protein